MRSNGLICGGGKNISLLQNIQTSSGAHLTSYSVCTGGLFSWVLSGRGMKLICHIHLEPWLRICGVIPLHPHGMDRDSFIYFCAASVVWTSATHWSFSQHKHYFTQQNDVLLMLATYFISIEVAPSLSYSHTDHEL